MAEPVSFKPFPEINTVPWINLQNPAVAKNESIQYQTFLFLGETIMIHLGSVKFFSTLYQKEIQRDIHTM